MHTSVNIIFKNHYMLIVKYIYMISHNKYLINSRSMPQKEMLVVHAPVSNFEGVHGERKIGNPSP